MKRIIGTILDELMRYPSFQKAVGDRLDNQCGLVMIHSEDNNTIGQVFSEYKFFDIRKDDIVLDIGANVGAFSIFMAKQGCKVYAVEPIMTNVLKENIKRNEVVVTVFNAALGKWLFDARWKNKVCLLQANSLSELILMCGGHVDFLKCDCEGGEWYIKPEELKGIRRIEMEIHETVGGGNPIQYLERLTEAGFEYTYETYENTIVVHARRLCNENYYEIYP